MIVFLEVSGPDESDVFGAVLAPSAADLRALLGRQDRVRALAAEDPGLRSAEFDDPVCRFIAVPDTADEWPSAGGDAWVEIPPADAPAYRAAAAAPECWSVGVVVSPADFFWRAAATHGPAAVETGLVTRDDVAGWLARLEAVGRDEPVGPQ